MSVHRSHLSTIPDESAANDGAVPGDAAQRAAGGVAPSRGPVGGDSCGEEPALAKAGARLEAAQREADDARGRRPVWERNPKGGQPYKRAYGEPDDKAQSNFTAPDSAIMKTSAEGFQQCYNAQVAVDGEQQSITAPARTLTMPRPLHRRQAVWHRSTPHEPARAGHADRRRPEPARHSASPATSPTERTAPALGNPPPPMASTGDVPASVAQGCEDGCSPPAVADAHLDPPAPLRDTTQPPRPHDGKP